MKASPTPALVVPETEFLLQVLVVPLDAPVQLRQFNRVTCLSGAGPSADAGSSTPHPLWFVVRSSEGHITRGSRATAALRISIGVVLP